MSNDNDISRRDILQRTGTAITGVAGLSAISGSGSAAEGRGEAQQNGHLIEGGSQTTPFYQVREQGGLEANVESVSTAESCWAGTAPCSWSKFDSSSVDRNDGTILLQLYSDYWYDVNPTGCWGEGKHWFEFQDTHVDACVGDVGDEVESVEITTELEVKGSNISVNWPPEFENTSDTTAEVSQEYDISNGSCSYQDISTVDVETDCKWSNVDSISGGETTTTATFHFGDSSETLTVSTGVGGLS